MEGGTDWLGLGSLGLGVIGALWGFWKYIDRKLEREARDRETQIGSVRAESKLTAEKLTELRIHVADTYATKEIVEQANERVMSAINDLGKSIDKRLDRVDTRLDRAIDDHPSPRSRAG